MINQDDVDSLVQELAERREEVERLRAALAVLADRDNYRVYYYDIEYYQLASPDMAAWDFARMQLDATP